MTEAKNTHTPPAPALVSGNAALAAIGINSPLRIAKHVFADPFIVRMAVAAAAFWAATIMMQVVARQWLPLLTLSFEALVTVLWFAFVVQIQRVIAPPAEVEARS